MPETVVSARESFPPARSFSSAAPESEALDAALSRPRAEDFDKGDVDGDGLLTPEELAGVLVRSCHAREADALELVRVCFGDVDLDKDGRVCFDEYRAFCKKAKRVLRRRAGAGAARFRAAGSAAPDVRPQLRVRAAAVGKRGHTGPRARAQPKLDALVRKSQSPRPASARLLSRLLGRRACPRRGARAPARLRGEDSTMDPAPWTSRLWT